MPHTATDPSQLRDPRRWLTILLLCGAAGMLATVAGLGIDAWLHAADPGLAAREGIFTLSNPGHLLLVLGIVLATAGSLGALSVDLATRPSFRGALQRGWVRAVLVAVVLVAVGGAATVGTLAASDAASHSNTAAAGDHGATAGGATNHGLAHALPQLPDVAAATPEQVAAAQDLLNAAIADTAKYRDPAAARAAGYHVDPNAVGPGGKPARFIHAGNPANGRDGVVLDPSRPESLVYWNRGNGQLVLVGVLFKALPGQPGPAFAGPIARWHYHESCVAPGSPAKAQPRGDGTCPTGTQLRTSGEMMHVWFTDSVQTAYAIHAPVDAILAWQRQHGVSL